MKKHLREPSIATPMLDVGPHPANIERAPISELSPLEALVAEEENAAPFGARPFSDPDRPRQGVHRQSENYRPLTGARENNRGGAVIFRVASDPTDRVKTIVETPRDAGEDAESILVTLGAPLVTGSNLATPVELVAVLDWGVGGAAFHAEVDWVQGTLLALPASFVKVGARLARSEGLTPIDVTVGASLAYGTPRGGFTSPARRTVDVDDLPFGTSSPYFAIPRWARSFVVLCTTTGAPQLRAHVSDADPATWTVLSDFTSRTNAASLHAGAVDIPNGARVMKLSNLSGSEAASSIRVIFALGL